MNKEEEKYYLELFQELYIPFPKGNIIIHESPDFIVESTNKKYGIELSKVYQNTVVFGIKAQAVDSMIDSINEMVTTKLSKCDIPFLDISIIFTFHRTFMKKQREVLSNKIVDLIIQNIPTEDKWISLEYNHRNRNLIPREITSMRIFNFTKLDNHFVRSPRGGWVQEDMIQELQQAIDKKNSKITSYVNSCDERWLLLHTAYFSSACFFNPSQETLAHKYQSSFDKIIFLNCSPKKLYELKKG